jgi:hypothetical protein
MEDRVIMDIPLGLEKLGYLDEEQSPSPEMSTYQAMLDGWRHSTKEAPTEADLQMASDESLVEYNARNEIARLENLITPRLMRDIWLNLTLNSSSHPDNGKTGLQRLRVIEDAIVIERAKL